MNLSIWKRIIRTKYGAAVGLCILLQGLVMAVSNPLLPIVISDRVGLNKVQVTVFFLILTLIATIVTLVSGYLSDGHIARYKLVVIGGLIAALGNLGIATAAQPIHVFVAGAAIVMLAVLFPQLFAIARIGLMGDWEREDQIMGITALRTLYSLGYIFGTGLASGLTRVMDIQAIYFIIAGGVMVVTACSAFVLYKLEDHAAAKSVKVVGQATAETRSIILPLYVLIVPLAAVVILQGAESTRTVYLSLVTFQLFKDASIAPLMFGITATAELITMGLLGYLSSKIGAKNAIAFGAVIGGLSFMMMSFSQSLPVLYASQLVYAVFVAALEGVAMAYVQGLLGRRVGMGGSLYMAVMDIGSLVGILSPLLVAGYDQTVFVIPVVLCVMGALLLMIGDRTAQIEKRLKSAVKPDVPIPTPVASGN